MLSCFHVYVDGGRDDRGRDEVDGLVPDCGRNVISSLASSRQLLFRGPLAYC